VWAKASFVSNVVLISNKEDSSCSKECTIRVFNETWQMGKRWWLRKVSVTFLAAYQQEALSFKLLKTNL